MNNKYTHEDFQREYAKLHEAELFYLDCRGSFIGKNARPFICVGLMSDGFAAVHLSHRSNDKVISALLKQSIQSLESGDMVVIKSVGELKKVRHTHQDFRKEYQNSEQFEKFYAELRLEFIASGVLPFICIGLTSDGKAVRHIAQKTDRKIISQLLKQVVAVLKHSEKVKPN